MNQKRPGLLFPYSDHYEGETAMKRLLMCLMLVGGLMAMTSSEARADHRHGRSNFGISISYGNGFNGMSASYGRGYGFGNPYGGYGYGVPVYNAYPTFSVPVYRSSLYSVPVYGGGYGGGYGGFGHGHRHCR